MKIRLLDAIEFHNSKPTEACRGKIKRGWRSETTRTDYENTRRLEAALAFDAEDREHELASIPPELVGTEGREISLWARHRLNLWLRLECLTVAVDEE